MKLINILFFILLAGLCFATTYNTINIDGTIDTTGTVISEDPLVITYNDWMPDENMGAPETNVTAPAENDGDFWRFWMTWDADYLYLGFQIRKIYPSGNDGLRVYIDALTGGSITGPVGGDSLISWTPEFVFTTYGSSASNTEYYKWNGTDWGTAISINTDPNSEIDPATDFAYVDLGGNGIDVVEVRIAWSVLDPTSGGPTPFNILTTRSSPPDAIWPDSRDDPINDPISDPIRLTCPYEVSSTQIGTGIEPVNDLFKQCEPTDGGLPVTLTTFTALYLDNNAVLQWVTASENNNLGWNVYRSVSQNLGQALQVNNGLIPGAGNSTVPTYYDYADEGLKDYIDQLFTDDIGSVWYWIESISTDGETETHGPVMLQLPQDDFNLQVPDLPDMYGLHQNYPNPFNPNTSIYFNLNQELTANTLITIYNMKGEPVKRIPVMQSGYQGNSETGYSVVWDGTDESGNVVPSGIYLYRLQADNFSQVKKMILMK